MDSRWTCAEMNMKMPIYILRCPKLELYERIREAWQHRVLALVEAERTTMKNLSQMEVSLTREALLSLPQEHQGTHEMCTQWHTIHSRCASPCQSGRKFTMCFFVVTKTVYITGIGNVRTLRISGPQSQCCKI